MNRNWKSIRLDGTWELYIEQNRHYDGRVLSTLDALNAANFIHIPGSVPGNYDLDMQREGLIPDLFYGENTLLAQEMENNHLWYARTFEWEGDHPDNWYFNFEGIDTISEIYLNGELIGETDNMLIPHEIPAAGLKPGKNELVIHIIPVFIRARERAFEANVFTYQKYNADSVAVRKAAHMYGWDIMPRILSGGIWRSVSLFEKPAECIEDAFIATLDIQNGAKAHVYFRTKITDDFIKPYYLLIKGTCGDHSFCYKHDMWHTEGRARFDIPEAKLWWPKGMGEPNLYDISIELYKDEQLLDVKTFQYGFRTVELLMTETLQEDGSGEFLFKVNGEKMFVRGTNWVPVDAFHSRDVERLAPIMEMVDDVNCNMIRVWGGNVYESDAFYEACDRQGVAVWQDFCMGCNLYPQDEQFQKVLRHEADVIIPRLRHHACLFLWVGDNECDCAMAGWNGVRVDPNTNVLTRQVLPDAVHRLDPFRIYMPSSPYISPESFRLGLENNTPENHLWGPRLYYKADFYSKAQSHFASETGYHGCPSPASLARFIEADHLWPKDGDPQWLVHAASMETSMEDAPYAYRIELMSKQLDALFGIRPNTLEEFALASQINQAEAFKYFIERFRLGKFDKTTGIIWWNLIDGWPQISDAVVDYYYEKKLAYHVIKNSQATVGLMFHEPEDGQLVLGAVNDSLSPAYTDYRVTDLTHNQVVLTGSLQIGANMAQDVGAVPYLSDETTFYQIEWTVDGVNYRNHYLAGEAPVSYERCIEGYRKSGLI